MDVYGVAMSEPSAEARDDGAPSSGPADWSEDFRAAVVDLLGALAYGELMAFS